MKQEEFQTAATRVSLVSMVTNVVLTLLKLAAGLVAHSGAMISDAVHSASDIFSGVIVLIGVKISSKEPDEQHPYGHERYECVAALLPMKGLTIRSVTLMLYGDWLARPDWTPSATDKKNHREAEKPLPA